MIGIYKFTNKINQKVYVGQSINIQRRVSQHKNAAYNNQAQDYNSQFHQAIRKYGWDNFDFQVLVEISQDEYTQEFLDSLEKLYINQYDSYYNGYNATPGGSDSKGKPGQKGENNGRALLTLDDVKYIRECYNDHIPFKVVYEQYKTKISKRGLQKVWWFDTWKEVYPEYYTEENRKWHATRAKANPYEVAANNKRQFSPDEVRKIRDLYDQGISVKQIQKQLNLTQVYSTIYNIALRKTYKDIK